MLCCASKLEAQVGVQDLPNELKKVSSELWDIEDDLNRERSAFSIGAIMGPAGVWTSGESGLSRLKPDSGFVVIAPTINLRVLSLFSAGPFYLDLANPVQVSRARQRLTYFRGQSLPHYDRSLAQASAQLDSRTNELTQAKAAAEQEEVELQNPGVAQPARTTADAPPSPLEPPQATAEDPRARVRSDRLAYLKRLIADISTDLGTLILQKSQIEQARRTICALASEAKSLGAILAKAEGDAKPAESTSVDERCQATAEGDSDHAKGGYTARLPPAGRYLGPHVGIGYGVALGPDKQDGRASGVVITAGIGWVIGSAALLDLGLFATQHGAVGINVGLGAYVFDKL